MTFGKSLRTCFSKYATFSGRASRSEFWWFMLFLVLLDAGLDLLFPPESGDNGSIVARSPISFLLSVITFRPSVAVSVRRMHDVNKHGAFVFIPIYNIVLWATAGTQGPNEYGGDPLATEHIFDFEQDKLNS